MPVFCTALDLTKQKPKTGRMPENLKEKVLGFESSAAILHQMLQNWARKDAAEVRFAIVDELGGFEVDDDDARLLRTGDCVVSVVFVWNGAGR